MSGTPTGHIASLLSYRVCDLEGDRDIRQINYMAITDVLRSTKRNEIRSWEIVSRALFHHFLFLCPQQMLLIGCNILSNETQTQLWSPQHSLQTAITNQSWSSSQNPSTIWDVTQPLALTPPSLFTDGHTGQRLQINAQDASPSLR